MSAEGCARAGQGERNRAGARWEWADEFVRTRPQECRAVRRARQEGDPRTDQAVQPRYESGRDQGCSAVRRAHHQGRSSSDGSCQPHGGATKKAAAGKSPIGKKSGARKKAEPGKKSSTAKKADEAKKPATVKKAPRPRSQHREESGAGEEGSAREESRTGQGGGARGEEGPSRKENPAQQQLSREAALAGGG